MYGFNAAIYLSSSLGDDTKKIYEGYSGGFGFQVRLGDAKNSYLNIEMIVPQRSQQYYDDLKDLKSSPIIKVKREPSTVLGSIGYHFQF